MMLPIRGPIDDGAIHLAIAEAEVAKRVVHEKLEAIAIVAVSSQGLF